MIQRAERIAIWRALAWWLAIAAVVVLSSCLLVLTVHEEATTLSCFVEACDATTGDRMAVFLLSRVGATLAVVALLLGGVSMMLRRNVRRRSP